jgi:hypothetical protein
MFRLVIIGVTRVTDLAHFTVHSNSWLCRILPT